MPPQKQFCGGILNTSTTFSKEECSFCVVSRIEMQRMLLFIGIRFGFVGVFAFPQDFGGFDLVPLFHAGIDIDAFDDATEDRVLSIEMGGWQVGEEEL